ncbi:hypothetical protein HNQ72_003161 [Rhizobium wenxiniae]|uniref:Uncharacterized protein n=1 Tax=Rhizobium wenxiniae TaxID=1737357 RepID=A0A7W9Y7A2_9HYPH|nr:hypothetical protein [Rhizobium wenxiniae]MBB6163321.1 hypothetical protein [Rhizobium wenxiniae]
MTTIDKVLYPGQRTPESLDTDEALPTFSVSRMPQPLQLGGPIAIDGEHCRRRPITVFLPIRRRR